MWFSLFVYSVIRDSWHVRKVVSVHENLPGDDDDERVMLHRHHTTTSNSNEDLVSHDDHNHHHPIRSSNNHNHLHRQQKEYGSCSTSSMSNPFANDDEMTRGAREAQAKMRDLATSSKQQQQEVP